MAEKNGAKVCNLEPQIFAFSCHECPQKGLYTAKSVKTKMMAAKVPLSELQAKSLQAGKASFIVGDKRFNDMGASVTAITQKVTVLRATAIKGVSTDASPKDFNPVQVVRSMLLSSLQALNKEAIETLGYVNNCFRTLVGKL